jgi:transcriptional regulator with XRE-family HTH domain
MIVVTISQNGALTSELHGDGPLSPGTRAFIGSRARNAFFSLVHERLRRAKAEGLTQAKLAERLGKDPGRLSNTLSSPGNWTIDTIAELLFGISRTEVVAMDRPLLDREIGNARARDLLDEKHDNKKYAEPLPPPQSGSRFAEVTLVQ